MNTTVNSWFNCFKPHPNAKVQLFCFPYAGGGAIAYREWYKYLPDLPEIELYTIQLPGRESRLREPAFNQLEPLVEALSQALLPNLNKPFAFFGHSMGGLIAFEVSRYLRKQEIYPEHLFVSGARAPHIRDTKPPIHNLPQSEFVQELRRFNGTPAAVLENVELMELLSPTLRADFAVLETYIHTKQIPLSCPITAFGGIEDTEVTQEELAAWQQHTSKKFSIHMLPGDHFFLNSARESLLNIIKHNL
jgi:medium-chain acyl-[acyl-carrier-protein] hydrolase